MIKFIMKYKKSIILVIIILLVAMGIKVFLDELNTPNKKTEPKAIIIDNQSEKKEIVGTGVKKSELDLRFIDESTGFVITPDNVKINRRNGGSEEYFDKTQRPITIQKQLENGLYDITVTANGYKPMSTYFDLQSQTVNVNFNMTPVAVPKELSVAYVQSLHSSNSMVLVGTTIDDVTGKPLSDVEIFSKDGVARSKSDKKGFFHIVVPLAYNKDQLKDRGVILYKKEKYKTEIRENFDMWPNGDAIVKIRMVRGNGQNRVRVIQDREVNQVVL
jgi:hypothetical protein